ncbi:RagB/SusD family nutrient uptake outer membrane protein [Mariniphaga sediminis]|uniref:RagB/SusD family nutrient uptake outer membrane protein n=1 Tax=Mariniphaga sediminis TaxID=1628158 RepID=A0A399D431_9BACT|nr:RagB/SusD family nutrient uptake outer membrane protein [Mariniphaga sediminis]RIH65422.1 RagB/SusD family nutrient uptake outer membrane protein [Mariniphaga sediminis]
MKILFHTYYHLTICLFVVLLMSSCDESLDLTPKSSVSDETLWVNESTADLFLNNAYSGISSYYTQFDAEENWSDDALNGVSGLYSWTIYAHAAYNPDNVQHFWGSYSSVRKCNLFIEKVNEREFDENWKVKRLAEARFLRAYFYMWMSTAHGGLPIITNVLNYQEQGDEIFRPRNSAAETFQFIIDECEAIVGDLPLESSEGRATKGAALALKGYCELFWASPLYNTNNELNRWASAAATYKRIMDLGIYELFPDYNTMFFEENNGNVETIFAKHHLGGTGLASSHEGLRGTRMSNGSMTGWGLLNPTQEVVDEYFMANGLLIYDPESGYNPQNPYANREKRFYQSIVFDGGEWNGDIIYTRKGVGSGNEIDLSAVNEATGTGYYLKKGMNPKYAVAGRNNLSSADFIIFRYGEVLLSYAEAQNEAVGPDLSVYEAINSVRERSELPPLAEGLSQDEMRAAIHQERRVELAFENKRWRDLLRLKMAEEKLNGTFHAMLIEEVDGELTYTRVPAAEGEVTFDPSKNYLLPIPQSAIDRNPKLEQNPGY